MKQGRAGSVACLALLLNGCAQKATKSLIVIGVDGMDPGFVERHWSALPNLGRLAREGHFSRLATTTPPQSPVAWSTFATGLDPGDHGIFDFVHRDPETHQPFLSSDRTEEPRFNISFGPYRIPLSSPHIKSLRKGKAFWQTLSEHGIPVTIVRMPVNYPPLPYGRELSGMETPDLRGTQSTFSFYTDNPDETPRVVPGGLIRKAEIVNGHADLLIEGPPDSLRRDQAYATAELGVDIDPDLPYARLAAGGALSIVKQGEWSDWLTADFPLLPHVVSARGMFRVFAKQLHPRFEVYVSPVNIDPEKPALPISAPASFAREFGRFYTVGIPEDTAALRQGVFDLPEFLSQSRLVLNDERRLLRESLDRFKGGFLFFYFSSVDQNSHILWGKHDAELLGFYRAVDASIGEVLRREPGADLIVMSDHGFAKFDYAVNLNTWLLQEGYLNVDPAGAIDWAHTTAYAMGLNAVYITGADRSELRRKLLDFKPAIESITDVHAAAANRAVAPDMIVGYAPGYRASWQTGLGELGEEAIEPNTDAWIADHCIDAREVPGVLFTNGRIGVEAGSLKELSRTITDDFSILNRR